MIREFEDYLMSGELTYERHSESGETFLTTTVALCGASDEMWVIPVVVREKRFPSEGYLLRSVDFLLIDSMLLPHLPKEVNLEQLEKVFDFFNTNTRGVNFRYNEKWYRTDAPNKCLGVCSNEQVMSLNAEEDPSFILEFLGHSMGVFVECCLDELIEGSFDISQYLSEAENQEYQAEEEARTRASIDYLKRCLDAK